MHITTSGSHAAVDNLNLKQNDAPAIPRRGFHSSRPTFHGIGKSKGAVIEAALSPVKYAVFAALGYTVLRWIGYIDDPTATVSFYARSGFFGGVVLVILFFIQLLLTSKAEPEASESILCDQAILIVKEMIYSAIAACIGWHFASGVHRRYVVSMVVVGAVGAFTSFVILYVALGVVVGLLWVILRCGVIIQRISHS